MAVGGARRHYHNLRKRSGRGAGRLARIDQAKMIGSMTVSVAPVFLHADRVLQGPLLPSQCHVCFEDFSNDH